MKRRTPLSCRQGNDTEESVFADFEELLLTRSPANNLAFVAQQINDAMERQVLGVATPCVSIKDAVALAKGFFGPAVRGDLSRAKLEDNNLGAPSRKRTHEAEQRKRAALVVAARLLKENKRLRLPRKKSELATCVWKQLAKDGGKPPPHRTIRRWLDEMIAAKK
jgi:hypothetical protein